MRKYLFTKEYRYYIGDFEDFDCIDFSIKDGTLTVKAGFAHDGCTPKLRLPFNLGWIGTPDGETINNEAITQKASGVHDVLYNWKGYHTVSRKEADLIFYLMLKEKGFKLAKVYYLAVRCFGWIMGKWD